MKRCAHFFDYMSGLRLLLTQFIFSGQECFAEEVFGNIGISEGAAVAAVWWCRHMVVLLPSLMQTEMM